MPFKIIQPTSGLIMVMLAAVLFIKYFGGLQAVKNAGAEDLAKAPGISPKLAQRIYELFH